MDTTEPWTSHDERDPPGEWGNDESVREFDVINELLASRLEAGVIN